MLATIDNLREACDSGLLKAFCAVGIEHDDATRMWTDQSNHTTRLQMLGALQHLLLSYWNDEIS